MVAATVKADEDSRSPHGERGLKFSYDIGELVTAGVAPRTGSVG